jgi:CRP/FNR family transcriptional regulator, cyclic AMP receptor protein
MAGESDYIKHLGEVALFSACSRKELQLIAKRSTPTTVPAGKTLTTEGSAGREFFVIDSGSAVVRRGGRKVATLGPGQWFGELSLLDNAPRNATVVAETEMEVLVLTRPEFTGLLDEVPGLARKLLTAMARRLRESDARAVN